MLDRILRMLRRSVKQRPDLQITMVTREGCHLCEDAWEILTRHQQLYGFFLDQLDVDSAPTLVWDHGQCIPVVVVNGKVRFRGKVNEVLLRRLLEAAE
jgi:Glutaredoxin-like domain (DUF836)